jgi:hypothetical protein
MGRCCSALSTAAVLVMLVVTGATTRSSAATPAARAPEEALLDHLVGRWVMSGQVMGDPVTYTAEGARVLQDRWVRLHLLDRATPPGYEASVHIGFDPAKRRYVVHWLDNFGAAGAGVAGFGTMSGDTLALRFDYASGPFRDWLVWHPERRGWTFLLESADSTGAWREFARYEVTPTR